MGIGGGMVGDLLMIRWLECWYSTCPVARLLGSLPTGVRVGQEIPNAENASQSIAGDVDGNSIAGPRGEAIHLTFLPWRVSGTGQHSRYLDVRMGHAASALRTL